MSNPVYYNFPEIILPVQGLDTPSSKEIHLSIPGLPATNIMLNDQNYSAYSIFLASETGTSSSPMYLIVKCYADVNDTTSNLIYLAIPTKIDTSDNAVDTDIDNIINATKSTPVVTLNLNDFIKHPTDANKNVECAVTSTNVFPVTITLDTEIRIKNRAETIKCYDINNISNFALNPDVKSNKNAFMKQQDLDWIMSCELLTEDGPTKTEKVDPDKTANTISLFLMSILIAGVANFIGPIIYTGFGMYAVAHSLNDNHYSANIFWGATLISVAILCIIQGIKSKDTLFYFIAIGLVLSYFAGTSGVLGLGKTEITKDGNGFDNTEQPLQIYWEILSYECNSTIGLIIKYVLFLLFIGSFCSTGGAIATGSAPTFTISMSIYFTLALAQFGSIYYLNKKTVT